LVENDESLMSTSLDLSAAPECCKPVQEFLEFVCNASQSETEPSDSINLSGSPAISESLQMLDQTVGSDGCSLNQYYVPLNLIERWGSAMGILICYC